MLTIWIAHTTFCTAYVAIVVSARLRELDLSIEEAAMDLGAKPWKVFFLITIPMIAPSLAAGAMMSFALSLDDLVLASFVSGPGSTTLPMEVFSAVRLGVKPEINAVASLILLGLGWSASTVAGSVQIPPNGQPVLFLRDHAVTGGYPVIATVLEEDIDIAAQLPPGARVNFELVAPQALNTGEQNAD